MKAWETISLLMKKSAWGRMASSDSLLQDIKKEIEELYMACMNNDAENAKEEASDVIMLVYCMLYNLIGDESFDIDELSVRMINKLYRRYSQVLEGDAEGVYSDEKILWSNVKKIEHKIQTYFCDNNDCGQSFALNSENIDYRGGELYCKSCSKRLTSSRNNLFPYCRNPHNYLEVITSSIIGYAKGDELEPYFFKERHSREYQNLVNMVIHDQVRKNVLVKFLSEKFEISHGIISEYMKRIIEMADMTRTKNDFEQEELLQVYLKKMGENGQFGLTDTDFSGWEKIYRTLSKTKFDIDKVMESPVVFHARSWDNQVARKYLLCYPSKASNRIIECMALTHFSGSHVIDFTVEISSMYGCTVGCRFCASGALTEKPLMMEPIDYLRQVNTCVIDSGINPADYEKFYVSFAGIGEPSCCGADIGKGMRIIRDIYPHVKFNIATMGFKLDSLSEWGKEDLPIRTLQIPLYHTDKDILMRIIGNLPDNYSLFRVLDRAVEYKQSHKGCRIKLNYIPFQGINDSNEDVEKFSALLEPYKEDISIKVSVMNYTRTADINGFKGLSMERLDEICRRFRNDGFEAYVFGSERNNMLGCGQLVQNHISEECLFNDKG